METKSEAEGAAGRVGKPAVGREAPSKGAKGACKSLNRPLPGESRAGRGPTTMVLPAPVLQAHVSLDPPLSFGLPSRWARPGLDLVRLL